jgi:hypothetical protein
VERALSILNTMQQQGLKPDIPTYNSVIDCIARHGTNPEHAQTVVRLYHIMTEEGDNSTQPDMEALNGVFNALEAVGSKEIALETYKHAFQNGFLNPWKHKKTSDGERIRTMVSHPFILLK